MKTKQQLLQMLFVRLAEIQSGTAHESLLKMLKTELSLLYDILGDEVPEVYWEQIEDAIS